MTDSETNTPEPGTATTLREGEGTEQRQQPKRRKRTVISCVECHRRKQKCDRELPCGNCKFRGKESACRYDAAAPTMRGPYRESSAPVVVAGAGSRSPTEVVERKPPGRTPVPSEPLLSETASRWGYSHAQESTGGLLRKIEARESETGHRLSSRLLVDESVQPVTKLRDGYKAIIRQLPPKTFVDKLVDIYVQEFNWQYYVIDKEVFLGQLAEWNKVPFHVFSTTGPQDLPGELRAFPALLFQVMATALLVVSDEAGNGLEALKYAGTMTFADLALDYSDSGSELQSLLGKTHVTFTTVQAGFMRAGFLKYTAQVIPSWHAVRSAIGDAQEIGMHQDRMDPTPSRPDHGDLPQNAWLIQLRRRLYMILVSWDIHCAVVLGRPATVDWRLSRPSLPIDASIPRGRTMTRVVPRDEEKDPPTPLTRAIWAFKLSSPLRDIRDLEQDGPNPKDFSAVDQLHQRILDLELSLPGYFRLEGTNWRWDNHPECSWLVPTRFYLAQMTHFSLMALHRPYIFNRSKSRTEALKAALVLLRTQNLSFQGTQPNSFKNFLLFYNSFDAIVLIATVYIFFPRENSEFVQDAMQHFEWTAMRFEAMQQRNPLARSAKAVIQAIFKKFRRVVENSPGVTNLPSIANIYANPPGGEPDRLSPLSRTGSTSTSPHTTENPSIRASPSAGLESGGQSERSSLFPGPSLAPNWAAGNVQDFSSLAPMHPTEDLFFNSLDIHLPGEGSSPGGGKPTWTPANLASFNRHASGQSWLFGGDFGEDSVWSALNQYY